MTKIALIPFSGFSGVNYYRSNYPFSRLGYDLTICAPEDLPEDYDILAYQFPYKPEHVETTQEARKKGKRIWLDYDDDFTNIYPKHKSFIHYKIEHQKSLIECYRLADIITVSTPGVAESIAKHNRNVLIVPNATDLGFQEAAPVEGEVRFAWRGADSHLWDLLDVEKELTEAVGLAKWRFFGWFPHYVYGETVQYDSFKNFVEYIHHFKAYRPHFLFVPLLDNTFNRAKSCCSWLEATAAGAVVIAPKLPEFEKPGIIHYSDKKELAKVFKRLSVPHIAKALHRKKWEASKAYIEKHLLLENVNQVRGKIVEELVKASSTATNY